MELPEYVKNSTAWMNGETIALVAPDATPGQRLLAIAFVLNMPYKDGKQESCRAYVQESGELCAAMLANLLHSYATEEKNNG